MSEANDDTKQVEFIEGHALLIAIAGYTKVRALPSAVINDGREIKAVLTSPTHCGYDPQNVTLVQDEEATLDRMRHELETLADRTKPTDTAVIFFSGHGVRIGDPANPGSALVPVDCDPANLFATVLHEAEFSSTLARITARRLVVFIDACHGAAAGTFKGGDELADLGFNEKSLSRLAQGSGRVLIASSRGSETSLIFNGAANSLFTEHLLGALRGAAHSHGDGFIRIFEVFNHVAEKVRAAAPGRQHPVFKASDLEDNFPFALDRGGVKSIASPMMAELHETWRQFEEILADLYPAGPLDQEIWARAGGDVSRLRLSATGRASWFAALRTMRQGGGGPNITRRSLLETALEDFPHHRELAHLLREN